MEHLTLSTFLDRLASTDPVPGGGSAASVAVAMSAALQGMACGLTLGRERFAAVAPEVEAIRAAAEPARTRALALATEDAGAYEGVMAAMKRPRGTPEEKTARAAAILATTRVATRVPLELAELAAMLLRNGRTLVPIMNPNARSDGETSTHLAHAGLLAALAVVALNLAGFPEADAEKIEIEARVARCRALLA